MRSQDARTPQSQCAHTRPEHDGRRPPCLARQVMESNALSFSRCTPMCARKVESLPLRKDMTSNAPVSFEVEFGVRSDVSKDKMLVMVKLAQEIDESHGIGQPTAECQLMWPSTRKLVIWSRGLPGEGWLCGVGACSCRVELKTPWSVFWL